MRWSFTNWIGCSKFISIWKPFAECCVSFFFVCLFVCLFCFTFSPLQYKAWHVHFRHSFSIHWICLVQQSNICKVHFRMLHVYFAILGHIHSFIYSWMRFNLVFVTRYMFCSARHVFSLCQAYLLTLLMST